MIYIREKYTEAHEESCWGQLNFLRSVIPTSLHVIVLCVTLDSNSATIWRNHISVFCMVNLSSPGTIYRDTWRVILETINIFVLCVTRNSYKYALCGKGFVSRNHLKRRKTGHANSYLCARCVKKVISINHQKSAQTVILGNSISLFWFYIQEHSLIFLVQLLPKVLSFANVISR